MRGGRGGGLRRESGVEARNRDQLLHLIPEEKDAEMLASGWVKVPKYLKK